MGLISGIVELIKQAISWIKKSISIRYQWYI